MRMRGKVVLVTGSTRGIGKGIAHCCAREGARVVVHGRSVERGEGVAAEIRKAGGEAIFMAADIGGEEEISGLIAKTVKHYGQLTTLINNAAPLDLIGSGQDHAVDAHNLDAWERILRLCLTSVMLASKYAIPELRKAGGGSIIHIGSGSVHAGNMDIDAYMASKSALVGLTRSMAAEYARDNIRVNCLHPGFFTGDEPEQRTMEPLASIFLGSQLLKYWGETEDIGWACVWLASDEGRFVTGTNIPIDGGQSVKSPIKPLFRREE